MKKTLFTLMCLVAMMAAGTSLKAQEVTIDLMPGWNWISYPNAGDMEIGVALDGFVPMNGDIIKSQYSTSRYYNGRWIGGVTHFVPGRGYKYYSNRTENVELVFAYAAASNLTTTTPTNITTTSAMSGGTATLPEGSHVFMCGVCYGTEPNPDIDDSHTSLYEGVGTTFTSTLDNLTPNTTYYVRAYAVSDYGLAYGDEVSFTTLEDGSSDHEYVDLGLPSGTLWATYNVGANTPEEYGDYFAWGETQPKNTTYNWSTYQYSNGSYNTLTKYCNNSNYGYNGFTDTLTTLLPEDDAAMANWGSDWRMPTMEEWEELYNNTTCTLTTQNGVRGRLFTASNGNSLFLPSAGHRANNSLDNAGSFGYYWSSSLDTSNPRNAWYFYSGSNVYNYYVNPFRRDYGLPVRAVRVHGYTISVSVNPSDGGNVSGGGSYEQGQSCTLTATPNEGYVFTNWTEDGEMVSTDAIYSFTVTGNRNLVANFIVSSGNNHNYVDLGLPSGTLWATCNVGADMPEGYGDYFAWGETQPKSYYDWSTYQHCNGGELALTKYCYNSSYGYNGYTDNLTTLLPEDDAATANWGSDWRMPTKEEWQELYNTTTQTWKTQNGVYGKLFTASNGNSLFLPTAGFRTTDMTYYAGSDGLYWSSSLTMDVPGEAWYYTFYSGYNGMNGSSRACGYTVRPVRSTH